MAAFASAVSSLKLYDTCLQAQGKKASNLLNQNCDFM